MPRSNCSVCNKRIADGNLCEECARELDGVSSEALEEYVTSLSAPPAAPAAPPSVSAPAPTNTALSDPRLPAPEFAAALRNSGLTPQQIAAELQITVSTAKELVRQGQRSDLFNATREWAAQRFIPKILANLDRALNNDIDGTFSQQIAKDMGIWTDPKAGTSAPEVGPDDSFESWKFEVTKKVKSAARRQDGPVVAEFSDGEVVQAEPADAESGSPEGRDEGD